MSWERRFEATTDPVARLTIVREAADELARIRAVSKPRAPEANGYRVKPPGRPCTLASGTILERASKASGLPAQELLDTLGRGRQPDPALVAATLAELDAGSSAAAVARELGCDERTIRRWAKCPHKSP